MPINPNNLLSYPVWLSLNIQTKLKLAEMFTIPRRGTIETINGFGMVQDGFVHSDLAVITRESMQEKGIKFDEDYYKMFKALVESVENPKQIDAEVAEVHEKAAEVRPSTAGRRGRPKKGSIGA